MDIISDTDGFKIMLWGSFNADEGRVAFALL